MSLVIAMAWGALPEVAAGQEGSITGLVRDAVTSAPVAGADVRVPALGLHAVSSVEGRFEFRRVRAGVAVVQVTHAAYGWKQAEVDVPALGSVHVLLELQDTAIVLSPIDVDAVSAADRDMRGAGFRRNVVTREQLASYRGMNMSFSDVMRQAIPGVRVRTIEGVVGAATCIELRSAATSRGRCLSPAVYVDGVPVHDVSMLYANFPLDMIESVEVVPAAEAGGRFGSGALHGAVLIESRRPGASGGPERLLGRSPFHDWGLEDGRHRSVRSFGAAAVGATGGILAGVAVAESCISTRAPSHDRLISSCPVWSTVGSVAAAILLPSLGSGLGARLGGGSAASRGQLVPAVAGGAMGVVPGYAMVLTGKRLDSEALRLVGVGTLLMVTPLMSTLADHQFRRPRGDAPPD